MGFSHKHFPQGRPPLAPPSLLSPLTHALGPACAIATTNQRHPLRPAPLDGFFFPVFFVSPVPAAPTGRFLFIFPRGDHTRCPIMALCSPAGRTLGVDSDTFKRRFSSPPLSGTDRLRAGFGRGGLRHVQTVIQFATSVGHRPSPGGFWKGWTPTRSNGDSVRHLCRAPTVCSPLSGTAGFF
jgi:hypothetical protein